MLISARTRPSLFTALSTLRVVGREMFGWRDRSVGPGDEVDLLDRVVCATPRGCQCVHHRGPR